ncbi:MAG TPA: hypothetical protein VMJ66_07165 [Geobacteraceae bacterium]|nr:hypothetical protein [Geobacteraceae bacterium]
MKQATFDNKLCLSCRRSCKQPKEVVIARCPRYYAGPRIKRNTWKQLEFTF